MNFLVNYFLSSKFFSFDKETTFCYKKRMKTIYDTIYSGEEVIQVVGCTRTNLANWLRRGLLDRLSTEKEYGKHRRYSASDMMTVAAMNQLVQLGMKPSKFTNDLAMVITSGAVYWVHSDEGMWGETRPEHDDLHRWIVVYYDPNYEALRWSKVAGPNVVKNYFQSITLLIDCQKISRKVIKALVSCQSTSVG